MGILVRDIIPKGKKNVGTQNSTAKSSHLVCSTAPHQGQISNRCLCHLSTKNIFYADPSDFPCNSFKCLPILNIQPLSLLSTSLPVG